VIKSRNVVFLEDQPLKISRRKKQLKLQQMELDLDPVPSPIVHGDGEAKMLRLPLKKGSNPLFSHK